MQVVLVMFTADGERRSFSLPRTVTVIGRREDCDLRIPLGEVSRKHCRFIIDDESLRLEDLGSSNGTFHNNTRIQEATIRPGDIVQIGPVIFTIQIDGVPADDQIRPPTTSAAPGDTSIAPAISDEKTPTEDSAEGFEVLDAQGTAAAGDAEIVDLGLEEIDEVREEPPKSAGGA